MDVQVALQETKTYLELMRSKMVPEPDDNMRYAIALDVVLYAYR